MSAILIVESEPVSRELLKKVLEQQGHAVVAAAGGRAALAAVKNRVPDLILLDLAIPDIDGVKFLQLLRADPASRGTPVVVLTALSNPRLVQVVARLGVRSYLLKAKFSWEVVESRIEHELGNKRAAAPIPKLSAPADKQSTPTAAGAGLAQAAAAAAAAASDSVEPAPPALTREQTLARVEQHTAAKTLAGVVTEVISMASSPRGSLTELVDLIKRDAVLATRVLQVANSAAFTTNKPRVTTVDEAVRNVGLNAVRNIATTVGIFEAFPPDAADGFNLMRCWQHSFAVAAILERITAQLGAVPPGAAHLVGLCHDLTEIVLRECFAERFERVSADAAGAGGSVADAQAAAFGVPMYELATLILAKVALPPPIASPIREYAELSRRRGGGTLTQLAQALRLADLYAHGLLLASSPHALVAPVSQAECRSALGQAIPEQIDGTILRCEVLATASLLARLSSKDERKLAQPLYVARPDVRLWYARHPSYSTFDPLGTALSQLCTVREESRLPRPEELPTCDAVVVTTPRAGLAAFRAEAVPVTGAGGVPVLYLAASLDEAIPSASRPFPLRTYPVRLSDLMTFVDAAETAKRERRSEAAA